MPTTPYKGKATPVLASQSKEPLLLRTKENPSEMAPSNNSNITPSFTDRTLTGIGSLIKLLPTGTVFLFQFLNPLLTNNGHCHPINKVLSSILLGLCSVSCFFSSFTDSYKDSKGDTHYGIATKNGLWPSSSGEDQDLSTYMIRVGDFVHAFFALIVFAVVSLLDDNILDCFYPSFESNSKVLLMVLPPVIGTVSGSLFMLFPNTRHGIGYPFSNPTTQSSANKP